jgi:RES domain-containing protein
MVVYRVTRKVYAADVRGEGARRYGGRWNHPLTPCLYTAESRALALLDFSVNTEADKIPGDLVLLTYEVPEDSMMFLKWDCLPPDWQQIPPPVSTMNMGNLILNETDLSVIGVPSSVVPEEKNYLLNYRNMPEGWPKIVEVKEISFDFRIKQ